jgi:hypothetical protein
MVPTVTVAIGLSLTAVIDTPSDIEPIEDAESVAVIRYEVAAAVVRAFNVAASGSKRYFPLDDWR